MEVDAMSSDIDIAVRQKYGEIARSVGTRGCCGPEACGCAPISSPIYSPAQTDGLPPDAIAASLGCGNPTALASLQAGQTVLDLGSGGGIDVLLAAKRVGPQGKVYGLDMTEEMLELARENQRAAGATNVEFLNGRLESIPLPDSSVDVVISNCVINLSSDKDAALREAFRVLRPGGQFAVSDVVVHGAMPPEIRRNLELWVGCIAGALEESDYAAKLEAAGFGEIQIESWRTYGDGQVSSAFVRARKPA
jgi:arsenite methyltransferase